MSKAQNLVPNPSFEEYTLQVSYNENLFESCMVNCWVSPTHLNGFFCSSLSPDLSSFPILINTWLDEQLPRTGLAKMTIYQVMGDLDNILDSSYDSRNYVQTQLIKPLIAGQNYTFKMYVSSGYYNETDPNYCSNYVPAKNLGVQFAVNRPMGNLGSYDRLDLVPQLSFSGIDFYTLPNGWMELSAVYTAQGGEEFITIGNFDYFIDTEFQNGTPAGVPVLTSTPTCPNDTKGIIAIDDVSLIPEGSTDTTEMRLHLGADTTICGPINLTLTADAGFSAYYWSTGETTQSITVTQAGSYWCRTHEFCASCADTIVVNQSVLQTINLGADTVFCTDGSTSIPLLAGSTFTSYLWNTGATTASISPTNSGLYWVEGTYACGTASDSIWITANVIPDPPAVSDTTVCLNTALIGSATGTNLLWYSTETSTTGQNNAPDIPTQVEGITSYFVTQTENGCESEKARFDVRVIAAPFIDLDDSVSACVWEEVSIGIYEPAWFYRWNDSLDYSPRKVYESGTYTLVVGNDCGTVQDSILVILNSCDCHFYLPNSFTPNGDLLNESYKPEFDCVFLSYEMRIFNRWGHVIFTSFDPQESWDGNYKGVPQSSGLYGVQVIYKDEKYRHEEIFNGHVVLLR